MKKRDYIDLYMDYLISIQTKAIGLSDMLEGEVSHEQITRFLLKELLDSKEYYKSLKHNSNLAKSNTKIVMTQSSHIFLLY